LGAGHIPRFTSLVNATKHREVYFMILYKKLGLLKVNPKMFCREHPASYDYKIDEK